MWTSTFLFLWMPGIDYPTPRFMAKKQNIANDDFQIIRRISKRYMKADNRFQSALFVFSIR
jgi:hypothetical protein